MRYYNEFPHVGLVGCPVFEDKWVLYACGGTILTSWIAGLGGNPREPTLTHGIYDET